MIAFTPRARRALRVARWWSARIRRDPAGAWQWPPWQQRIPVSVRIRGRQSSAWNEATERAHVAARIEHPPATFRRTTPPIDVICATSRGQYLPTLKSCFLAQRGARGRLIVVVNGSALDPAVVEAQLEGTDAEILVRPTASLGSSLNAGLAASDAPFAAKWDDDDWYGPWYLADVARECAATGAAIVGKHSYFAHLEGSDRTVLRFPGHDHRFTSFVAGGTLVIDRTRTEGVPFPDLSLGEDGEYLAACERSGGLIYAGSRFGYVQRRGVHNTWRISEEQFAERATIVGDGLRFDATMR